MELRVSIIAHATFLHAVNSGSAIGSTPYAALLCDSSLRLLLILMLLLVLLPQLFFASAGSLNFTPSPLLACLQCSSIKVASKAKDRVHHHFPLLASPPLLPQMLRLSILTCGAAQVDCAEIS